MKLPSPVVLTCSALLLASFTTAQFHSGMPAPLPGLPATPPPVDHPALGAQPLMGDNGAANTGGAKAGGAKDEPGKAMPQPVPGTVGPQKGGKDLKKAVAKVKSLKWCALGDAKARSAATGKPILLLQALGDLEGLA